MSRLKWIIKQKQIAREIVEQEFTIPGEPIIYSIKYDLSHHKAQCINIARKKGCKSLLKCMFPSYTRVDTPVVLRVRFYVSPPACDPISNEDLKKEKKVATRAYELCDYLLAFLELLRCVLINSYRQIVKIDAQKYYSDNPRTVMQFMSWEHYVSFQNGSSFYTQTGKVRATEQLPEGVVQPKKQRGLKDKGVPQTRVQGATTEGSVVGSGASPSTSTMGRAQEESPPHHPTH